jgi:hypothetical protein
VAGAALVAALPASADPVYTTIAPPHAKSTYLTAVNAGGYMIGQYASRTRSCGDNCAFIRAPNGKFTTFDIHNAQIYPQAINDSQTVVGEVVINGKGLGFIRTADGQVATVRLPGLDANITAINDDGVATGWVTGNVHHTTGQYSFVRTPDGAVTTFRLPRAQFTTASGINASGTVVGTAGTPGKPSSGFLRAPDGTITTFQAPNANQSGTVALLIDDAGNATGVFTDTSSVTHIYIRAADGTFQVLDIPITVIASLELGAVVQVGSDRQIVGSVLESDLRWHSFILHGDGTLETYDISQGTTRYAGTFAYGETAAGVVVGTTTDDLKHFSGYMRTP